MKSQLSAMLLIAATAPAPAADVFNSPADDGLSSAVAPIPETGSPVELFVYIDGGSIPSMPTTVCNGAGTGDEVCGWDLRIIATGDVTLDAFTPDGDVVFNLTDGKTFIANGGNPIDPPAAPQKIGTLTVSATAPGTVEVSTGIAVTSLRERDPITALLIGETDADSDGVTASADNCLHVANADQRDTNGDGIGNICDADLDNGCTVNFLDPGEMKSVFFSGDPDADLNGDGSVNFLDLGIMKQEFFKDYAADNPSGIPNICGQGVKSAHFSFSQ